MDPTTALLLVDVQVGFEDPVWGARNNPAAETRMAELLAHWRRRAWPVFHVQHLSQLAASPLRPGQEGVEIKPIVRPRPGEPVIRKDVNSAFIGTDLEEQLRAAGVRRLVVAGLTTDHCVSTTVRMAANLGFETFLAGDATATFARIGPDGRAWSAQELHEATLVSLHGEFATVRSTAELLAVSEP